MDSEPASCDQKENHAVILYHVIIPITHILCAITMLPAIYVHCRSHPKHQTTSTNSQSNAPTVMHYGALILFVSVFLFLIIFSIGASFYCHNVATFLYFVYLAIFFYLIQSAVLLQLLFYRLYIIYLGSVYALNRCTIVVWIIYFSIVFSIFGVGLIVYFASDSPTIANYASISAGGGGFMCALSTFWLVGMFISKLINLNKRFMSNDSWDETKKAEEMELINLVTRMTVLCFISTAAYMLTTITGAFLIFKSIYADFVWRMIILVDVYTSFLCILLSFKQFDAWYRICCKCCHVQCYYVWMMCCFRSQKHDAKKTAEQMTGWTRARSETNLASVTSGQSGDDVVSPNSSSEAPSFARAARAQTLTVTDVESAGQRNDEASTSA